MVEILLRIERAGHLNQADPELFGSHTILIVESSLAQIRLELLILFDIDGTLVRRAGPHHRQALVDAVRQVTGLETTTEDIPVHGMLDPDILAEMMRRAGATPERIAAAMPAIREEAQRVYEAICPDLRGRTCPGVKRLLQASAAATGCPACWSPETWRGSPGRSWSARG